MELKKYKLADIADFNKSSISKSETFKEIIYLDTSSITENVVIQKKLLAEHNVR